HRPQRPRRGRSVLHSDAESLQALTPPQVAYMHSSVRRSYRLRTATTRFRPGTGLAREPATVDATIAIAAALVRHRDERPLVWLAYNTLKQHQLDLLCR